MREAEVLLIDCSPDPATGNTLKAILDSSPLHGTIRRDLACVASPVHPQPAPSLIFLVLPPESAKAGDLVQSIHASRPNVPIIAVVEDGEPVETLELLHCGASDFITSPFKAADTLTRAWRLIEQSERQGDIVHVLKERIGLKLLIGKSARFMEEIKKIPLIAKCDSRVLITGETGTGKEMCARAIHYLSPRGSTPFVPVNCGAIPTELVENELFGHERGAFTGANSPKAGLIEEAEGGTLFLDEIDCLPLQAQVKLLRLLQENEYRRLGASKVIHANVRVIAASNATLEDAVKKGHLRQDLYYRLNVVSIALPALRERREDVPFLAAHFLRKYAGVFHGEVKTLSPEALHRLTFYDWPGNVRELEHTIERAVLFSQASHVREEDIVLPGQVRRRVESFREAKATIIEQFERDYIQRLLLSNNGNITEAAKSARKNRRAFWELIRKHHINVQGPGPTKES